MNNNKGKYRALLGVLVVFVIPFLVVSTVYLSNKPKTVTLDKFYEEQVFLTSDFKTNTDEYINFSDLDKDIKLVYSFDETTAEKKSSLLKEVYTKSLDFPVRDFKDPYPTVLFLSFVNQNEVATPILGDKNSFLFNVNSIQDSIVSKQLAEQKVLLLDRENKIRGEYDYTKESFEQLEKDLQNLMAETYFVNKRTERENRLKKKL